MSCWLLLAMVAAPALPRPAPPEKKGVGPPKQVTIKTTLEGAGGGFILPGLRVDVVSVVKSGKRVSSRVIEKGLMVLAVDVEEKPGAPLAVTVEATEAQARRLKEAMARGELRLLLRKPGE